jgi:hypothetical protein
MYKNVFPSAVRWVLATFFLGAMIEGATAGSFTRGCAVRDLQILMLIEEQQSTTAASAEKLNDALLTMEHARMVCHEGHVADALSIYDSISQSITPTPLWFGRRR